MEGSVARPASPSEAEILDLLFLAPAGVFASNVSSAAVHRDEPMASVSFTPTISEPQATESGRTFGTLLTALGRIVEFHRSWAAFWSVVDSSLVRLLDVEPLETILDGLSSGSSSFVASFERRSSERNKLWACLERSCRRYVMSLEDSLNPDLPDAGSGPIATGIAKTW